MGHGSVKFMSIVKSNKDFKLDFGPMTKNIIPGIRMDST
jgi:hypothetical protein